MDQLHEELKEPMPEPSPEPYEQSSCINMDNGPEEDNRSQSDNDFQSCESCGGSERADNDVQAGSVPTDNTNEAAMLIPEQDEIQANREWQKEKNMINDLYRSGVNGVTGASTGADMDKDVDTTTETTPIISSQGAIKLQGKASGKNLNKLPVFFLHFIKCKPNIFSSRLLFRYSNIKHHKTTESHTHGGTHSQDVQQPS